MMRINLLPHRQMKRAIRQREFGLMSLVALGAGCAIVFMGWTFLSAKKDSQLERNGRLEQAIVKLDKEIADIASLKDEINGLLERKQVVENLQINRSEPIVILDEITRQLPEGLYLKSIKQQGNLITLLGVADTQARIATLVTKLSASNWVESPNLIEIKASTVNGIKQNDFTMNVSLKVQKAEAAPDNKKIGAQQ
jgi:type IV pilus assembly protein PilN